MANGNRSTLHDLDTATEEARKEEERRKEDERRREEKKKEEEKKGSRRELQNKLSRKPSQVQRVPHNRTTVHNHNFVFSCLFSLKIDS